MEAREQPPLTITEIDIHEANLLSLHCPICANPVENYITQPELIAVECLQCNTLYHRVCWEQAGGKCAMIGCVSKQYRLYAEPQPTVLQINRNELGRDVGPSPLGTGESTRELKEQEKRMRDELYGRGIFRRFFAWLLNQIRLLDN